MELNLCQDDDKGKNDSRKKRVYKIKYSINLLPSMGEYILMQKNDAGQLQKYVENPGESFQSFIAGSDEFDIFKTEAVREVIDY